MLTETTITKLREMRLSVMANALKDQLEDAQYRNMAFEDRIGLIIDAEWNARKSNHLHKLIRQAGLLLRTTLIISSTFTPSGGSPSKEKDIHEQKAEKAEPLA